MALYALAVELLSPESSDTTEVVSEAGGAEPSNAPLCTAPHTLEEKA